MYKMKEPHPPQTPFPTHNPPSTTQTFPPYRPHIEMMRRSAHARQLLLLEMWPRVVSQPHHLIQSRVLSWNNLSANHRPRQPFDLTSFCSRHCFMALLTAVHDNRIILTRIYQNTKCCVWNLRQKKRITEEIVRLYGNLRDSIPRGTTKKKYIQKFVRLREKLASKASRNENSRIK